ncbi:PLP-dependent aminotransferase family protein [Microvirga sp. 3-52]|uniref:MocR-like pyridoxine biosynthesis transcription factor PdxR n=1 Tax=Microvirga sp. 3-52 TaxID=2792425 RepID=UPI001AC33539|nr:PLP-dependent aminotransferase family protein [Microvirga sp. 3-52]MBO1905331.1 PLP-dependent aminotransferase family protein [Microvirga sp. 3-52]MBS7452580.1 PLP-dependent aminotransferase family protein [Microvirga sp. 3-52]
MGARQIYEALRDQILAGTFGKDGRLPSSRSLALELGVSRTTVTVAYEQLLTEGFIEVRQGARPQVVPVVVDQGRRKASGRGLRPIRLSSFGERVRATPPWHRREGDNLIADFRYGDLSPGDFPTVAWKRAMSAAMAQRPERLSYGDPRGSRRLRLALQGYLWRSRTLHCEPEQIVIVNGSQQGLDLCARLILDPGDRFVIENPCYAMARQIFAGTGAMPVPVTVDGNGLRTDLLAGIEARMAYVTPSHQFPLGGVMSVTRRNQLIEWARQRDALVIEDDYDSEYRYDINPVPPLHGLADGGNVVYLGTVSKTLSPTLRIGYLVVPPGLQDAFATAKRLTDRHSPMLEQEALALLIESGAYEQHVRRARRLNGERRQTLLNVLRLRFGDRITVEGADAGLHVVVRFTDLPRSLEPALIERARLAGVGVHSTSPLYDPGDGGIRADHVSLIMGYSALDTRRIERGVHLLAEAVGQVQGLA